MEMPKEQIEQIKKQLFEQIEKTFPPEQIQSTKQSILEMNNKEFQEFLIRNKIIKTDSESSSKDKNSNSNQSPFRLIVSGEIPSYKIDENKDALAVLEINPVSKGHVILIPKKNVFESEKIPQSLFVLTKKISKKIKEKLKPVDIPVFVSKILGEMIINIVPVYNSKTPENLDSPRKKVSEEELIELQSLITSKKKTAIIKKQKTTIIKEDKIRLPRRIP